MRTPIRRPWYWSAVALILGAIVCQWIAHWHHGRFLTLRTHALVERTLEENRAIFEYHGRLAGRSFRGGLALVLLAIGSWVTSRRRQEHGLQSLLILLIVFYGLSFLLIS
jgi:hypothetical protein